MAAADEPRVGSFCPDDACYKVVFRRCLFLGRFAMHRALIHAYLDPLPPQHLGASVVFVERPLQPAIIACTGRQPWDRSFVVLS